MLPAAVGASWISAHAVPQTVPEVLPEPRLADAPSGDGVEVAPAHAGSDGCERPFLCLGQTSYARMSSADGSPVANVRVQSDAYPS